LDLFQREQSNGGAKMANNNEIYGLLVVSNHKLHITEFMVSDDPTKDIDIFVSNNDYKLLDCMAKSDPEYESKHNDWLSRISSYVILNHIDNRYGYHIREDSPDDLVLCYYGKPVMNISIPEMATQWRCL